MSTYAQFFLLGLGNGGVFAALAMALVVTYRSSGVLNFATGAQALYAAYTYSLLRTGQLLQPIPGLSPTINIGSGLGFWPALLITLAISAVMGALAYLLIFRPLRNHRPVAKAVASIGLMGLLTAIVTYQAGTAVVLVNPIFPQNHVSFLGVDISVDRLLLAATIIGIGIVLTLLFRFTRFGLATRASAESEMGALVSGLSPDRIALFNWIISFVVSGIAGVLIAPLVPLVPGTYTLFIVPALAAAVVGRFHSLGWAITAGLGIGALESLSVYLNGVHPNFPAGAGQLIPLVLVLVVLAFRGQTMPSRGTPRPGHPRPRATPALADCHRHRRDGRGNRGHLPLHRQRPGRPLLQHDHRRHHVVAGRGHRLHGTDLLGPAHLGRRLGVHPQHVRHLLGHPLPDRTAPVRARRRRGGGGHRHPRAARPRPHAWRRHPDLRGRRRSDLVQQQLHRRRRSGLAIPTPRLFGMDLGIGSGKDFPRPAFGIMVLVVLVLVALGVSWLRTSRLGTAMLAVRADERSAAAAGINVVKVKLIGFAIAAFIAGLGGSLLAYQLGNVTFQDFDAFLGLVTFSVVVVAGITSVSGGILAGMISAGGILVAVISSGVGTGGVDNWYGIVAGIGVILTVIFNPRRSRRSDAPVPRTASDARGVARPVGALIPSVAAAAETPVAAPAPGLAHVSAEAGELVGSGAGVGSNGHTRASETADTAPLLEVDKLTVRYGGVVAVDSVSFSVQQGQIVGLIGPNGAGKTTTIDALCGFHDYEGSVVFSGQDVGGSAPYRRAALGLSRTFQLAGVSDDLTVEENVQVGQHGAAGRDPETLTRILGELGLSDMRDLQVSMLSQGQRQLVSVARALAGEPRLLLLDEPAAGLDSTESLWLAERLRGVRDNGVTILLVDHDMSLVLNLCDTIECLGLRRADRDGDP